MKPASLLPYAAVAVVGVVIDQWVKWLVETRLPMHELIDVLPFLGLYRTYNTGVAFSMGAGLGDKPLIAITAVIVIFVLWLASRSDRRHWFARTGFALIISGAIGNLIDRSLYGHVIDYIFFHTPVWSFAVFNLADAFITVGAVLVVLQELLPQRAEPAKADPPPT